jgi:adenine-specific DNA-methyltransferase
LSFSRSELNYLRKHTNAVESEEFHKNLVSDFLKRAFYRGSYLINTKGRNDLVIHMGPQPQDFVGVIIEAKKPTNKGEVPTATSLSELPP